MKKVTLVAPNGQTFDLVGATADIVEYAARFQDEINAMSVGQVRFDKNGNSMHMTLQKIINSRGNRG